MSSTFTVMLNIAGEKMPTDVHPDPHFEEVVAMVLVEEEGTPEFLRKYCPDGKLHLGVDGGSFDEHPDQHSGDKREKGCCVTLLANALNVLKAAPEWKQLIAFCSFKETGQQLGKRRMGVETSHAYDPYSMLRLKFRQMRRRAKAEGRDATEAEQLAIIQSAMEDIRLIMEDQKSFHRAKETINSTGLQETISGPGGKRLKLVAVTSDEEQVNTAARAVFAADIVVQMDTDGHAHIFTRNNAGLDLDDFAQALKLAEQKAEGVVHEKSWELLRQEGIAFPEDRWYYAKEYGQLHNGTEHHTDFAPTMLSLDGIVGLVKKALDTQCFKYDDCQPANCCGKICEMYEDGRRGCRQVRGQMYRNRNRQTTTSRR